MHTDTRVIKVADFNLMSYYFQGRLEAALASEAIMTIEGNIHMDTRLIKVVDFKSEVI